MAALLNVMNLKGCERETPWKNARKISFADFETGTFRMLSRRA